MKWYNTKLITVIWHER